MLIQITEEERLTERERARRHRADELIRVALDAIEPCGATRRAIQSLRGQVNLEGCTVFAFGKAARGMAEGALEELTPRGGVVHCFESGALGPLKLVRSAHPTPAFDAAERGREVLELARSMRAGEVALCLVSGGGSSMLECPRPGVTLDQIKAESLSLMRAGADITTLNARRRELSAVKGGGLAAAIRPATVVTIVISDTPGASLETVASGPTLPADFTVIAADHLTARDAVLRAAPELRALPELLSGEARELGAQLATLTPGFVATGETTVTVSGSGRGGRNHELTLGALQAWRAQGVKLLQSQQSQQSRGLLLTLGTDGIDGSSDAAGAWCDDALIARAPDPTEALKNNNSHHYFEALCAQIRTGATGTNVADLVISIA